MNNSFIKLKERTDKSDFNDINNLNNACIDYDKIHLKLEIDYKLSNGEKYGNNMNKINEFMFYDDNKLVGYAGICDFGGDEIEVNGMVHPEYRRRGIFTRLFSLVKDEFNKRDSKGMLLLSDNNSIGGISFIKRITDDYHHSEYDMNLDMDVIHKENFDNLVFRKAAKEDITKIAGENFEFINDNDIDGILFDSTYVLETGNVIIGRVRLEIVDNIGGIYGLEILPEYRGKGYGRELLIRSINKLKESKVNAINLQVETKNNNALNLYKSCGFKVNYTMDYYILKK
ncbi:MAG: GNAT family N-acetyltransferase [Tissierellia bacterium]|nr:GNAT family N-acetyltransferase [Tissierellia bacterium]HQK54554.1 GNAT family N-acetyltransferase [Sedimentibacter sp.]